MTRNTDHPRTARSIHNVASTDDDFLRFPDDGDDEIVSSPPVLAKAMLALDSAKTEEEIAAARAILRVTGF